MLTPQAGVQVDKFYPPTDWQYSFPEGYTRLEYLESSRTQYIDTNLVPTVTMKYKIKYAITTLGNNLLFGSRTSGTYQNSRNQIYLNSYYASTGTPTTKLLNLYSSNDYNLHITPSTNTIIETPLMQNENCVLENATQPIYLFSLNMLGTATTTTNARIYYMQIFDNNTLVRNFVPVKRNSDNKPGMYDLVNNVFYVNQGTGEFVMGPELYSNNSQIDIRQKNNTNFVEKYKFNANNELVWANPQLNLSGPVNYSVVGSPTITDGVASNFSTSDYITIPKIDLGTDNFEIGICFKANAVVNNRFFGTTGASTVINRTSINITSNNKIIFAYSDNINQYNIDSSIAYNTTDYYYVIAYRQNTEIGIKVSTDKINWTTNKVTISSDLSLYIRSLFYIGANVSSGTYFNGTVDLKETYIKVNDELWFYGKNYTSQNYAPVPAGLNYNNTTTPSIGYVNTQTQVFTPAPTDGIKYSQTRDLKVIPPEDNTITLLYGTQESHHLPSEYEELQAIQSSGTQYILFIQNDEEINIKSWEIIAEFNSTYLSDNYNGLFGFQYMQNRYGIFTNNVYNNETLIQTYSNITTKQKLITTLSEPITFKYNDNDMFNGSLKNTSVLFGRNNTGNFAGSNIKIGPVKLYDNNGTLVRNLIPARRKSDSVIGMLDLANKDENDEYIFYTNAGTGTFTAVELKYKLFGLLANTSSGTYDVYIDDVLYATTASGTQTDIDFSQLGSEYVSIGTATTPEALTLHKIVIKPNTSGETITRFRCARTAGVSTTQQQGVLWCHFELDNFLNVSNCFRYTPYNNNLIAITAQNNKIKISNASYFIHNCTKCIYIPIIEINNDTNCGYAFTEDKFKRLIINNGSINRLTSLLTNNTNIEQVIINSNISDVEIMAYSFDNNPNLKLFPIKSVFGSDLNNVITKNTNLYPTKITITDNTTTKLGMYGITSYPMRGLHGLKVSNEAPFTGTSPQINVSYTGLDRDNLVELFNSMPGFMKLDKVGEPTIDSNGIVSGFSASDYLYKTQSSGNINSIEIVVKIQDIPSTITQTGLIIGLNGDLDSRLAIGTNGRVQCNYKDVDGTTRYLSSSKQASQYPYIRVIFNQIEAKLDVSVDGINWINEYTRTQIPILTNAFTSIRFGYLSNTYNFFIGSIDLENSYIKINNARYQFQLPDDTTTRAINITAATGNNLTKVGTGVTIDENGVASGFSSSDYLRLPEFSNFQYYELKTKFVTSTVSTSWQCIIGTPYIYAKFGFIIKNNLIISELPLINNNINSQISYNFADNTTYYAKVILKNRTYQMFLSTDNINWIEGNIATIPEGTNINYPTSAQGHTGAIRIGGGTQYTAFNGSIDLENTYIKIDQNYLMKGYLLDSDRAIATGKGWDITG